MKHTKIEEALNVLRELGLPRQQQNERSALTLLALLGLRPDDSWDMSRNPMYGITQMMKFFKEHYGKEYAPNTRETVRRQTVHQFLQAGLIVENPDEPERPTNSGKTVYQIGEDPLSLLQSYGTSNWKTLRDEYMGERQSLREEYSVPRKMRKIQLQIPTRQTIRLSPGEHNKLVERICVEFVERFAPGAIPLYVGDTAKKFAYFNKEELEKLGVQLDRHGKIPDVVVYDVQRNWIFLVEAVTSHGPINRKRRKELEEIFSSSSAGRVYVTAFADIGIMKKHIADISWETEVWMADSPDHMIHFDGVRFLGPYEYDN